MRVGKVLHTHTHTFSEWQWQCAAGGKDFHAHRVCVLYLNVATCKQIMLALTRQTPQSLDPAPAPSSQFQLQLQV